MSKLEFRHSENGTKHMDAQSQKVRPKLKAAFLLVASRGRLLDAERLAVLQKSMRKHPSLPRSVTSWLKFQVLPDKCGFTVGCSGLTHR